MSIGKMKKYDFLYKIFRFDKRVTLIDLLAFAKWLVEGGVQSH